MIDAISIYIDSYAFPACGGLVGTLYIRTKDVFIRDFNYFISFCLWVVKDNDQSIIWLGVVKTSIDFPIELYVVVLSWGNSQMSEGIKAAIA